MQHQFFKFYLFATLFSYVIKNNRRENIKTGGGGGGGSFPVNFKNKHLYTHDMTKKK